MTATAPLHMKVHWTGNIWQRTLRLNIIIIIIKDLQLTVPHDCTETTSSWKNVLKLNDKQIMTICNRITNIIISKHI